MWGRISNFTPSMPLSIDPSIEVSAHDVAVKTALVRAHLGRDCTSWWMEDRTLAQERRQREKRRAREVVWNMQARRWRKQEVKERARAEKRGMKAARRKEKRRMRRTEKRW